jgi:hypothetical protein
MGRVVFGRRRVDLRLPVGRNLRVGRECLMALLSGSLKCYVYRHFCAEIFEDNVLSRRHGLSPTTSFRGEIELSKRTYLH